MTTDTTDSRQSIILQAALHCFLENGYENSSIDDIRIRSGASVGSIYHHFGSKARIATQLFLDGHTHKHQHITDGLTTSLSADDTLRAMVNRYIEWTHSHQTWAIYLTTFQHAVIPEEQVTHWLALRNGFAENLSVYLTPHIKAGAIKAMPEHICISLVFGPVIDFTRWCLQNNQMSELMQQRTHFAEAAWQTLRT